MEGEGSNRIPTPFHPGKPLEVLQPRLRAGEPAAIGWAYVEPPHLGPGKLRRTSATYRVVLSCAADRRRPGSSG